MQMRIIPALAASAVLAFGLAACGNDNPTSGSTPGPAAGATTTEAGPTEAGPNEGGQGTPEAAAEVMLRAFGGGDARAACAIMSNGTQTLEGNEEGMQQCEQALQGLLEQLGQAAPELKESTVTGATINGDAATFENATVTPELGKQVLSSMKAAKIDGKWYMSQ